MTNDTQIPLEIDKIRQFYTAFREKIHENIVGYDALIDILTVAILTNSHVLLEGVPGTAKTTICKIFSTFIGGDFGRLQGVVDAQPADVLGFTIYNARNGMNGEFKKGPIFSNIFLIDEINRLTPKTQSALIEPLAERQVTCDGITHPLPSPFLVIASQNPYENLGGTFPLIDAQVDRFAYSVVLKQLDRDGEVAVLDRELAGDFSVAEKSHKELLDISSLKESVRLVRVSPPIRGYISDIVMATRQHADVHFGASTRGSIALLRGGQVIAAINGRDYVIPDDIKYLVPYTLRHRIFIKKEAALSGITPSGVLESILKTVPVR